MFDENFAIQVASKDLKDAANKFIDSMKDLIEEFVDIAKNVSIMIEHAPAIKKALPKDADRFERIWKKQRNSSLYSHERPELSNYQRKFISLIHKQTGPYLFKRK